MPARNKITKSSFPMQNRPMDPFKSGISSFLSPSVSIDVEHAGIWKVSRVGKIDGFGAMVKLFTEVTILPPNWGVAVSHSCEPLLNHLPTRYLGGCHTAPSLTGSLHFCSRSRFRGRLEEGHTEDAFFAVVLRQIISSLCFLARASTHR